MGGRTRRCAPTSATPFSHFVRLRLGTASMTKRSFHVLALLLVAVLFSACSPEGSGTPSGTQEASAQVAQEATVTPIPTAPAAARPTYTVQRGEVSDILEFSGRWLPR